MKLLNSINFFDGFKSVLESYALRFEKIKTDASSRNKEIDEEKKRNISFFSEEMFRIEENNTAKKRQAEQKDNEKRREYDDEMDRISEEEKESNDKYDLKIENIKHTAKSISKKIESNIELLDKTILVLRNFFGLEYGTSYKNASVFNFQKELKPVFAINKNNTYYWYKKYKYVFGETSVDYLHDAFERIGADVNKMLYNDLYEKNVITEKGIVEVVEMIFSEIYYANQCDLKRKTKRSKEKKEHIENAVYLYVQMICAKNKYNEMKGSIFENIDKQAKGEIEKIKKEKEEKAESIKSKKRDYTSSLYLDLSRLRQEYLESLDRYNQEKDEAVRKIEQEREDNNIKAQKAREETAAELREALISYLDNCLTNVVVGLDASPISVKEFVALNSYYASNCDVTPFKTPDNYRTFMCCGSLRYEYTKVSSFRCHGQLINTARDVLYEYFRGISGSLFKLDDDGITIPYVIDFTFFNGICFDYPSDKYNMAKCACQSLMFHMFTDTKAASLYYTMIDSKLPSGFFSVFNSFKGVNPRSNIILNNNKIFNNELDISDVLNEHSNALSNISSDFAFESIVQYNRHMEARKRPINVIFITDFNNDALLNTSYEHIKNIVKGTKCGYSCVFMKNEDTDNIFSSTLNSIGFDGITVQYIDSYKYKVKDTDYIMDFLSLPDPDTISAVGRDVYNCFSLSTADTVDFLKRAKSISKIENAYERISVDGCMLDKNNSPVSYELNDTYLHGLIVGDSGFGKTRLIHAIIAGIMNKYSPESVRINILDYKDSALAASEYTKMNLPHMGVISNITSRALGLNFLKYIDKQMEERTEVFKQTGANIDKYSTYMPWAIEQKMRGRDVKLFPREVIFIDEIQVLIGQDDEISKLCNGIINKIITQGRASGIHLIISTQWIHNLTKTLDIQSINSGIQNMVLLYSKNGYGELNVNPSMLSSVTSVGQAIYILDKNQSVVDVALIDGEGETDFLKNIENTYQLSNTPCNTVVLRKSIEEGATSDFARFYNGEYDKVDFSDLPITIGESIDFKEPFKIVPKKGNLINFMMISRDSEAKSSVSATIILSLLAKIYKSKNEFGEERKARIIYADFANNAKIVYSTINDALSKSKNNVLRYYDSFEALDGDDSNINKELSELYGTSTEIYLFINDIGEGMKNPEINKLFKIINEGVKVNLFVFGDCSEDLAAFELDSHNKKTNFSRAVYRGTDADYAYMVGSLDDDDLNKRGEVMFCRAFDMQNHEVVPFAYKGENIWVKNFIFKLLGE